MSANENDPIYTTRKAPPAGTASACIGVVYLAGAKILKTVRHAQA